MARVFVSHSSKDVALAEKVHRWLVDDGYEVFLDQDLYDGIRLGDQWHQRLHERLRWADAMVCALTPNYLKHTIFARRGGGGVDVAAGRSWNLQGSFQFDSMRRARAGGAEPLDEARCRHGSAPDGMSRRRWPARAIRTERRG